MSWLEQARCAGHPTDWWVPPPGQLAHPTAVALCQACPVTAECAADRQPGDYSYRAGTYGTTLIRRRTAP